VDALSHLAFDVKHTRLSSIAHADPFGIGQFDHPELLEAPFDDRAGPSGGTGLSPNRSPLGRFADGVR